MAITLYKARGMGRKQPVCAICVDRTRGRTQQIRLAHGVSVWLCAEHASDEFQRMRSGRDFVLTLHRVWQSNGCLTRVRSRALTAHMNALRGRPPRRRPGSYAWPELRRSVEAAFAAGASVGAQRDRILARLGSGPARPPSVRTLQRWRAERRWLVRPRPPSTPPPDPAATPPSELHATPSPASRSEPTRARARAPTRRTRRAA